MPFAHTTIEAGEDRHALVHAERIEANPWLPCSLAIHLIPALTNGRALEGGSREI